MTQNSRGGYVRTEEQARIDTEALKLRSLGWTYQQIADQMGCTKQAASDRCKRALAAIPAEAVDEYRRIEGERLDTLLKIAMNRVVDDGKGALFAIDRVLAIMDRRAKLLGLDAPTKTQVITLDYIESEIMRLEAELGDNDDAESPAPAGTEAS